MLTALAALLLTALAVGGISGFVNLGTSATDSSHTNSLKDWIKETYPDLTEEQVDALVAQYGESVKDDFFNPDAWTTGDDKDEISQLMTDIEEAYGKYGAAPEAPTSEELAKLQEDAYAEIDAENQRLLDLYNQTFQNSENMLQNSLLENSAMFGDYRNQILTNEAMRQQGLAGATRFELDRQQRNAIVRGASAAQRLVANINTQLGLQAQSAQQSLDTSNALAQNLLAHRQAQQGIRNDYMNAQNQHNRDVAGVIGGQTERRYNYGQGRKQGAVDDYNYAYDNWNENVSNSGLGSLGEGIYRNKYGRGQNNRSGI